VSPRRIILTHIPRTGGTSLFAALRGQCPEARAGEFESFSELVLMRDSELNSYELISTYIGSKLFERLDDSWIKIILLREPVARLPSSYWNLRNTPKQISFASAIAKRGSFSEYLASRDAAIVFHRQLLSCGEAQIDFFSSLVCPFIPQLDRHSCGLPPDRKKNT
jgi:hypothetical protein